MNTSLSKPASHSPSNATNPFARALAEARGGQSSDSSSGASALDEDKFSTEKHLQQEKARREQLKQKLHREVNPVEAHDVFNAREQQVKKEIEGLRYELKQLHVEMKGLEKEIDLTLSTNIASPGQTGTYYISFFEQLRGFIVLLRQKVNSAHTWATAFNSKKRKANGSAPGMQISGQGYEQTTTVFDKMHHERATAYSGS
ncbi:hypothetical protein BH10PAT2_BH10PAT2_0380 [soil metagenome]